MKHTLNNEERSRLDKDIAEAEKRTGSQIVLAVIERSDSYAELPWKAFALGSSVAGLLVILINTSLKLIPSGTGVLLAVVTVLSVGATLALLCIFVPDFARLFLRVHRAEVETRQYAESLFLSREMFVTQKRKSVLLMISLFERRIVVLPDSGLREKINRQAIENIIGHMRPYLSAGQAARALKAGLEKLEETLSGNEGRALSINELSDKIIEEKGA